MKAQDLARFESRMPRWMAALSALGVLAALLVGPPLAALAFGVGAALGAMNYFWLYDAVDALMSGYEVRVPRQVVVKVVSRYPLAFAGFFVLYRTSWVPLLPLVAGLLVPGAAAMIESIFLVGDGLREN